MSEAWLNFTLVALIQLLLFVVHAWYEKKLSDIPRILGLGVLGGVVVGVPLDLIFGKLLGVFSYELGFGAVFIALNATILYGLFVAHTLLIQRARLVYLLTWAVVVGAVFEVTNLSLRLWTYAFPVPSLEFFAIFFLGNCGVAILIAKVFNTYLGSRLLK